MSTKSHFIYEDHIEGFQETSEPQQVFGKCTGYNVYLIIENPILKSFKIEEEYLFVETKNTVHLPSKFKVWGDAVLLADWDEDGLMIHLKGGHFITKEVIENNYTNFLKV
jgi:hypothetical protein